MANTENQTLNDDWRVLTVTLKGTVSNSWIYAFEVVESNTPPGTDMKGIILERGESCRYDLEVGQLILGRSMSPEGALAVVSPD